MKAIPAQQGKIKTGIVEAKDALPLKEAMWNLYNQYYEVEESSFYNRINSNDYYAIYTKGDSVVGFTGLRLRSFELEGEAVMTLYLGQTVMHSSCRGKSLLPRTCSLIFTQHFLKNPTMPIYCWCDSLTYKPFLIFSNSLKKSYPSRKEETPKKIKMLINKLGQHYYKENFKPETGTVFKQHNIIDDPSAIITEEDRRKNPDIDFFAKSNPGYTNGHGLITIAPINFTNFLFLVKKCIKKRFSS